MKQINILLINPKSDYTGNVIRDVLYGCWCNGKRIGGATIPPLSLLSVATVLKQDGNNVKLIDMIEERLSFNHAADIICDYDIVIILTSTMSFKEDAIFLRRLKQEKQDIITIIFGSHATFMPQYCLQEDGIDIIVKKEPEFIIRDIIRELRNGKRTWTSIKGIGYKKDGETVINKDYPFIEDYDEVPILDRSLLPGRSKYFNPLIRYYPYTTSITSQGCPGICTFCTSPGMTGNKLRYRSASKVIEEIELLLQMGYREIYYRDETFTTFKKRNVEIFREIIDRRLKFSWLCNVRAGTVDREDLELMKKAGCRLIKIGVESGVQYLLNKSKKYTRVGKIRELFSWTKEIGIDTHAHIMFGMPGETYDTIDKTIDFLLEIEPATIDIGLCTPYPGSELFYKTRDLAPELEDGSQVNFSNLHTEGFYNEKFTYLSRADLQGSIRKGYRRFYLRPYYFWKTIKNIRMREISHVCRAGFNVTRFILTG